MATISWSQVAIAFIQGYWREEPHSPSATICLLPCYLHPACFMYLYFPPGFQRTWFLFHRHCGRALDPCRWRSFCKERSPCTTHRWKSVICGCTDTTTLLSTSNQPLLTRLQDVSLGEMLFLFRLGLQAKDTHSSALQEMGSGRMARAGRCLTLSVVF